MRTRPCTARSARHGARTWARVRPGSRRPLEPLDTLLEAGRVLALNFPVAMNPGLARIIGVMLKLDFQRAVLQRIPQMSAQPERVWRDLLFVCDEYHAFATVGETDPTGDERTFALSRQARLDSDRRHAEHQLAAVGAARRRELAHAAAVLPHQGVPRDQRRVHRAQRRGAVRAARSAEGALQPVGVGPGRARLAAHRPGRGQQAVAHREQELRAARTSTSSRRACSRELQNAQAIVLPYDGLNPLPPQFCYLKPHYLDVQTSYFDHLARGAL